MKKWILIPCGIGALVAGAAAALLVSINPVVEAGVNKFGPEITGTHVFLKKADISVFSGEGSLHEFTLGNPKGYSAPHAVKVGSVNIPDKPNTDIYNRKSSLSDSPLNMEIKNITPIIANETNSCLITALVFALCITNTAMANTAKQLPITITAQ